MNINNLYVVVFYFEGTNETGESLVSEEVFESEEKAKEIITDKKTMKIITLKEWASENYDSGYINAYG